MALDTPDLFTRAAAALKNPEAHKAAEIDALLIELREAEVKAQLRAEFAKADALNLALTAEEVAEKHAAAEAATFDKTRLSNAIEQLESQWFATLDAEKKAKRQARYDAALANRNRCSARIEPEYSFHAAGLLDLYRDIMETGAEVDRVNADLPEGVRPLNRPEGHLRDFPDHNADGMGEAPRAAETHRLVQMRLPDLDDRTGLLWPPNCHHHSDDGKPWSYWKTRFEYQKTKK